MSLEVGLGTGGANVGMGAGMAIAWMGEGIVRGSQAGNTGWTVAQGPMVWAEGDTEVHTG